MDFHASAQDIRLDDGHILRARLNTADGQQVDAEIDLNHYIGNNDGEWAPWYGFAFETSRLTAETPKGSLSGAQSTSRRALRTSGFHSRGTAAFPSFVLASRILRATWLRGTSTSPNALGTTTATFSFCR